MWELLPEWQTFLVGLVAAVGTYLAARWQGRSQVEAAKAQAEATKAQAEAALAGSRGPEWEAFTDKMETHFEKRFAQQDVKIASLGEQVSRLTEMVASVRNLYHIALAYIRQLWVADPGLREKAPPPTEIAEDLADMKL